MAIRFRYRDVDMTVTDFTDRVDLDIEGSNPGNMASNAEERSVGSWTLLVDDEDGTLDWSAYRTVFVDDTDYPDANIWVGFTVQRDSSRDHYRTAKQRRVEVSLSDLNSLFERRVILDTDDGDRPAETDVERMAWLYGTGYLGLTDDWISTANPVDMDAVDYTGRMVSEIVEDCMQQSTKNAFWFDDPDGIFAVFYGDSSANTDILSSDLRITNVLADVDNVTTWEASMDANWQEEPSRVYSRIFANYDGGTASAENATTVANFAHRDTVVSWPDVKTEAKALARINRQLNILSTEEHVITVTIDVPPDHVNDAPAGYRVQCLFTHFPDYADTYTWMRILNRAVTWVSPERYRIKYTLSPGTPPPPAVTCSAQNPPAITARVWTNITGGSHGNELPFEDQPPTPSVYPCVVFDGWGGGDGLTVTHALQLSAVGCGTCSSPIGSSDYTVLDNMWSSPINLVAGYKALTSGDPPLFAYCTDASCDGGAFLSFALATAATAPLQVATDLGASVSFPNPMTPGSMLVMYRLVVTNGSGSDGNPELNGWTRALTADGSAAPGGLGGGLPYGGVAAGATSVWTRCVQPGDTQVYSVGASSFARFNLVSEWAIT